MELEGEGTEEKPFLINTEDDFKKFVKMHPYAYYKQTRDLNLSGFTAQTGGAIVNVQGDPFKGIYDGGGHKITGLQLKNENITGCAALFHTVSGTVKNLTDRQLVQLLRPPVGRFLRPVSEGRWYTRKLRQRGFGHLQAVG